MAAACRRDLAHYTDRDERPGRIVIEARWEPLSTEVVERLNGTNGATAQERVTGVVYRIKSAAAVPGPARPRRPVAGRVGSPSRAVPAWARRRRRLDACPELRC